MERNEWEIKGHRREERKVKEQKEQDIGGNERKLKEGESEKGEKNGQERTEGKEKLGNGGKKEKSHEKAKHITYHVTQKMTLNCHSTSASLTNQITAL